MNNALPTARSNRVGPMSLARPYAESLAMVAASTFAGLLVAPGWGTSAVDLLFLPAVLAAAGFYGLAPGLVAAGASTLAFNYYFTQPVHSFVVTNPEDIITVTVLFLVALVTSQLAARMRSEARAAERSAARNATIAGLARRLLGCATTDAVSDVACRELARLFDCNAVMLDRGDTPSVMAAVPAFLSFTPGDLSAAQWAMESGRPTGRGSGSVSASEWTFFPVRSGSDTIGAIGLARDDGQKPVADNQLDLLDNLVDQLALALERGRLESERQDLERLRESDRVRSTLLSSIGQDLEPHLTEIAKGARALQRSATADKSVTGAIASSVARLQHYLANLLELGPPSDQAPLTIGPLTIDLYHRSVSRSDTPVHLAPKEYGVLAELAKHPGRVLTHAHLLRAVWGPAQEKQVEYLRVAVRALRQKLEEDPAAPRLIVNEPSVGYRLASPASSTD